MTYKTPTFKGNEHEKQWFLVDLKGKVLGKAATQIANLLRGKNKPDFSPHMICGDYIVAINAKDIKLTGNKMADKEYFTHSGYNSGLKTTTASKLVDKKPEELIKQAVFGMLPKNRLRKEMMLNFKIFSGQEHTHSAQTPKSIEI